MNNDRDNNIVLSSLIADALSLGSHWIYSQNEIAETFASVREYHDPASPYHPGKLGGDFTHYGDQAMVRLRSLPEDGGFDLETFARDWVAFWENPGTRSYVDGATRGTLDNLRAGALPESAASPSNDIPDAFPVILHFLLRYPVDAVVALEANLRAGGDSAARSMILGMVYGAQSDAITAYPGWADGLSARDEIEFILNWTPAHV